MEDRVINIESKLAYQEDLIEQLNQVIIQQQKEIDIIKLNYNTLKLKIQEMTEIINPEKPNAKPPHY